MCVCVYVCVYMYVCVCVCVHNSAFLLIHLQSFCSGRFILFCLQGPMYTYTECYKKNQNCDSYKKSWKSCNLYIYNYGSLPAYKYRCKKFFYSKYRLSNTKLLKLDLKKTKICRKDRNFFRGKNPVNIIIWKYIVSVSIGDLLYFACRPLKAPTPATQNITSLIS